MDDEELERGIRRDPRFLIRIGLVLVLGLLGIAFGLAGVGRLDIGRRIAEGFSTLTESPRRPDRTAAADRTPSRLPVGLGRPRR